MKADQFNGVLFLAISILMCLASARIPYGNIHNPGPGFLPLWLGVILGMLSIGLLIRTTLLKKEVKLLKDVLTKKIHWGRALAALGALIFYGVLLNPIGFLLVTFLFIVFLIRYVGPQSWKTAIGWAMVGSVGSYLIFEIWMELRLPKGFLGV